MNRSEQVKRVNLLPTPVQSQRRLHGSFASLPQRYLSLSIQPTLSIPPPDSDKMQSTMAQSSNLQGLTRCPVPRTLLLITLLVSLLTTCALLQSSSFAVASPDPVAHANPEALVVPKSRHSAHPDHADAAANPVKANSQDDDDDLTTDTGDDIAELGDPMAPVTTESPTRTRTGDPEVITTVVADGGDDAAVVLEADALLEDPASDVIEILVPPPKPEHVPGARVRRDGRNLKRDEIEFTQAVELDKIVPVLTDVASDALPDPASTPVPVTPAPGQVVAGRPTLTSTATSARSTATRPTGSSTSTARATSTARPGTGGSGGDSNPDSHSGDQTLEILITDNSAVGTGPGTGTGKGANVDFAVNGFGVSVSGSLKRGAPAPQAPAEQVKQTATGEEGKKARENK